jgi:hypothetical protein
MFQVSVRKGLFYAAATYLMLATAGTLFLPLDALYFDGRRGEMADQGAFLTALVPTFECPVINRTKERPFSQYLLRMIIPISFFIIGTGLLCATARLMIGVAAYNIKNTILLKLRI